MITLTAIRSALAAGAAPAETDPRLKQTAVAMLFSRQGGALRLLFIERAPREGDPWSGDLGFPGGKMEETDRSPRAAAERETLEEIGLDLADATFLGRLPGVIGAHLPVQVSCFVYQVRPTDTFSLSEEVRDVFWVGLGELTDPARYEEELVRFRGEEFLRPAIRLSVTDKPVLWGITYRLVQQFLQLFPARGNR